MLACIILLLSILIIVNNIVIIFKYNMYIYILYYILYILIYDNICKYCIQCIYVLQRSAESAKAIDLEAQLVRPLAKPPAKPPRPQVP